MPYTISRLNLLLLCTGCLIAGLSVGNVEQALEHGYSPVASAVAGALALGQAIYVLVGVVRDAASAKRRAVGSR